MQSNIGYGEATSDLTVRLRVHLLLRYMLALFILCEFSNSYVIREIMLFNIDVYESASK